MSDTRPSTDGLREALDKTARIAHTAGFTDSKHVRYAGTFHGESRYDFYPFEECPDDVCVMARAALGAPSASEVPSATDATERRDSLRRYVVEVLFTAEKHAPSGSLDGNGHCTVSSCAFDHLPFDKARALLAADAPRSIENE